MMLTKYAQRIQWCFVICAAILAITVNGSTQYFSAKDPGVRTSSLVQGNSPAAVSPQTDRHRLTSPVIPARILRAVPLSAIGSNPRIIVLRQPAKSRSFVSSLFNGQGGSTAAFVIPQASQYSGVYSMPPSPYHGAAAQYMPAASNPMAMYSIAPRIPQMQPSFPNMNPYGAMNYASYPSASASYAMPSYATTPYAAGNQHMASSMFSAYPGSYSMPQMLYGYQQGGYHHQGK